MKTPRFWRSNHTIALALYPISLVFRCLVAIRRASYRAGLLRQMKVEVPVIVVGNITAGGAGKTPLVIALARHLQSRGWSVGVLCGGYGGTARKGAPMRVDADTDAAVAGDEPVVIARQTALPVVVAKDRVAGARLLQTDCDCIIVDDGLQHYRLQRDLEVVVVDAERRFGNELMLPAGPLREPVSRLRTVDMICYSGERPPEPGYTLQADALVNVSTGARVALAAFGERRVHALAGIAYPQKFFNLLRAHGFEVVEHSLPDHYRFDADTLRFTDKLPIIMTEKDFVKCRSFAPENTWYLAVSAMADERLLEKFDQLIGRPGDGS